MTEIANTPAAKLPEISKAAPFAFPKPVRIAGSRVAVFATEQQAADVTRDFEAVIVFNASGVKIVKGENLIDAVQHENELCVYSRLTPGIRTFQCWLETQPLGCATFWITLRETEMMVQGLLTWHRGKPEAFQWQVIVTEYFPGHAASRGCYRTGYRQFRELACFAILEALQEIANRHYGRAQEHPLSFDHAESQKPVDIGKDGYKSLFDGTGTYVVR